MGKGHEETFWGDGNILFVDLFTVYLRVYLHKKFTNVKKNKKNKKIKKNLPMSKTAIKAYF